MLMVSVSTKRVENDISRDWVNSDLLDIVSAFVNKGVFKKPLTDVGPLVY